jgi:hypothetical protein
MSSEEAYSQGRVVYFNRAENGGVHDIDAGHITERDPGLLSHEASTDWRGGDILNYLQELSRECAVMAEAAGFTTLAALYRVANEEAQRCSKRRR